MTGKEREFINKTLGFFEAMEMLKEIEQDWIVIKETADWYIKNGQELLDAE